MSNDVHRYYLMDIGPLLVERAQQARNDAITTGEDFAHGTLAAYYDVIALMLSQASGFGMAASYIGLEGVDPEQLIHTR